MLLNIGKDGFTLPVELVTSTQAILARKRSGKSYTASVQAEELLERRQQVAVIDPTGAWWGLKSSADGREAGYPIVVFGGDHADAPLDFGAGKAMAAALVEHGFSAIFDIRNLETSKQLRFVMDFAAELLRINRNAMHLFIDEADTFAPQKTGSALQFECLGTVTRLVSQGGIAGVGVTMITQRSAKINWDVLSQVDILTVLRMGAPNDLKPVVEWLQSETSKEFAAQAKAELPSLPVGSAFIASAPLDLARRVEVRLRHTFNSGATPKPGERRVLPKVLAAIDMATLGREIAESAKKARESSPEFLRERIAQLEAAAKGKVDTASLQELERLRIEVASLRAEAGRVSSLEAKLAKADRDRAAAATALREVAGRLDGAVASAVPVPVPVGEKPPAPQLVKRPVVVTVPNGQASEGVSMSEQRVLDALASLEAVGVESPSKTQLAAFAGYSNAKSGGFAGPAAALGRRGLIESTAGRASLTEAGRVLANRPGRPASSKELQERIFALLGDGERKLLTLLIESYPDEIARVDLAARGGYSNAKSGGFAAPLARLLELGFVENVRSGVVRGSEMLFLKGGPRGKVRAEGR